MITFLMVAVAQLLIGLVCAGIGGELFVRGTVGMARCMRIPPGIIAATFAAFATSSPELSVAIGSALTKDPQISLGDALGSNVVNIALILGLSLFVSPPVAPLVNFNRELVVALVVPLLVGLAALDGTIARWEGWLLLSVFGGWMVVLLRGTLRERGQPSVSASRASPWEVVVFSLVGLGLLIIAGDQVVRGARALARFMGIGEFVVGATMVAIGTSVPELATTLAAFYRRQETIGFGIVLGSNIFNGLLIVPLTAVLCPISVHGASTAVALVASSMAGLLLVPGASGHLGRARGFLLLTLYVLFVFIISRFR
jgi:cation:H+ antiporter